MTRVERLTMWMYKHTTGRQKHNKQETGKLEVEAGLHFEVLSDDFPDVGR